MAYAKYSQLKEDVRALLTVQANVDQILGYTQKADVKEKEHDRC